MTTKKPHKGSIVCVGLGMTLGAHISPRSRSYIEQADVVFVAVSDHVVELWVKEMNTDVRSLQPYYQEGKDRRQTYRDMVSAMMAEVRAGKSVVGAFYGHPGVFALPPHKVIAQAKKEGFNAHMEPGISAEACLYAAVGIDPGRVGCQHFEASQFMFYQRKIDTSAYLVLWQIGIAGDTSHSRFSTQNAYRQILLELLLEDYPSTHQVVLYECATLAIQQARIDWMPLADIGSAPVSQQTTLLLPPSTHMSKNQRVLNRLAQLESAQPDKN